jgi:hypothetical protein
MVLWTYLLSCGHHVDYPSEKSWPLGTTTWCDLCQQAVGVREIKEGAV